MCKHRWVSENVPQHNCAYVRRDALPMLQVWPCNRDLVHCPSVRSAPLPFRSSVMVPELTIMPSFCWCPLGAYTWLREPWKNLQIDRPYMGSYTNIKKDLFFDDHILWLGYDPSFHQLSWVRSTIMDYCDLCQFLRRWSMVITSITEEVWPHTKFFIYSHVSYWWR